MFWTIDLKTKFKWIQKKTRIVNCCVILFFFKYEQPKLLFFIQNIDFLLHDVFVSKRIFSEKNYNNADIVKKKSCTLLILNVLIFLF